MSDVIFIRGILIHARHGLLEHESEVGELFAMGSALVSPVFQELNDVDTSIVESIQRARRCFRGFCPLITNLANER